MGTLFNQEWGTTRRRALRNDMTPAEKILWRYLKNDALGVRFRRQFGIGSYIVDFCIPTLKIVIELDGNTHDSKEAKAYDKIRDDYIRAAGFTVIRFRNDEVYDTLNTTLDRITMCIAAVRGAPPPNRRGLGGGIELES